MGFLLEGWLFLIGDNPKLLLAWKEVEVFATDVVYQEKETCYWELMSMEGESVSYIIIITKEKGVRIGVFQSIQRS